MCCVIQSQTVTFINEVNMISDKEAFSIISKNKGDNWIDYRIDVESFAVRDDSIGILEGTEKHPLYSAADSPSVCFASRSASIPTETQIQSAVYLYEKKRNSLAHLLVTSQSERTKSIIIRNVFLSNRGDATGMWKALKDFYEPTSRASIKQLIREAINSRRQGSEDIATYLNKIDVLKTRTEAALRTANLLDPLQVLFQSVLLDSLDPKYGILTQHLFLDDTLTYDTCRMALMNGCFRIDSESGLIASSHLPFGGDSAMKVVNPSQGGRNKFAPCPYCKKTNHPPERCFLQFPELKNDSRNSAKKVEAAASSNAPATTSQSFSPVHAAWIVKIVQQRTSPSYASIAATPKLPPMPEIFQR